MTIARNWNRTPAALDHLRPAETAHWLGARCRREGCGDLLGGKGEALQELAGRGVKLPAGWVVPAQVHRAAVSDHRLARELERVAAALDGPEPPTPGTLLGRFPGLAAAVAELRGEIETALSRWPGPDGAPSLLAVRSSAVHEDGEEHSFAGILETLLGVPPCFLPQAVLLCWASMQTARARGYCARYDLLPEEISVAVVIQEMVRARAAGVLLTRDPLSPDNTPVINAVRGLGSALVDGSVEPDEYRAGPRGSWSEHRGGQRWKAVLTEDGVRRVEVSTEERLAPILSPHERRLLVRMGRRIERLRGGPQDVEWAIEDRSGVSRVWILQARPITGPGRPVRTWTRANMRELFPELPSPMTASLIERYKRNWMVELFACRGFRVAHLGPAIRFLRGRPYFNQSLLHEIAGATGMDETQVRRSVGGEGPAVARAFNWRKLTRNLGALSRLGLAYLTVEGRARRLAARIERDCRRQGSLSLEAREDRELLRGAVDAFRALRPAETAAVDVMGALELWTLAARGLLKGVLGSPGRFLISTTAANEENVTARQVRELEQLIEIARGDESARAVLHRARGGRFDREALRGTAFGRALDSFLERYGCRAMHECDSAVPRFSEDPTPLLQSIAAAAAGEREPAGGERSERQQAAARECWAELWSRLPAWERLLPARAWLIRRIVAKLRYLYQLREELRLEQARLAALRRTWELALADRWTARGWIERPEDYFWLRVEDVEAAVARGDAARRWLRMRVEQNRARWEAWAALPVPNTWCDRQSSVPAPGSPAGLETRPGKSAGALEGLPVSPGIAEGEVLVLRGPEELERVKPGRILVMPAAGPSWSPLFASARGLVIEVGGVLSHGSILAREYGLPAVANIGGATSLLRTGDRVVVDGNRGTVEIVRRAGQPAAAPAASQSASRAGGHRLHGKANVR